MLLQAHFSSKEHFKHISKILMYLKLKKNTPEMYVLRPKKRSKCFNKHISIRSRLEVTKIVNI